MSCLRSDTFQDYATRSRLSFYILNDAGLGLQQGYLLKCKTQGQNFGDASRQNKMRSLIDDFRGQRTGDPRPSGNQARPVGSHPKCGYFTMKVSDTASPMAFFSG